MARWQAYMYMWVCVYYTLWYSEILDVTKGYEVSDDANNHVLSHERCYFYQRLPMAVDEVHSCSSEQQILHQRNVSYRSKITTVYLKLI